MMEGTPTFSRFLASIIIIVELVVLSSSLSAFPGAQGFGSDTVGGSGRHLPISVNTTVYRVTTLNLGGPGTLRECIIATGPRVCVFEVSGCLTVNAAVPIENPYITIAGQTAPSPGFCLNLVTLIIRTHDVIIQHFSIRVGDSDTFPLHPNVKDAIDIQSGSYNVLLDHLSLAYAIDEVIGMFMTTPGQILHNITISHCFVTHSLMDSLHTKGVHGMGILVAPGCRDMSIYASLIAHHMDRPPLIGGTNTAAGAWAPTHVEMVNNVVYNIIYRTEVAHNVDCNCTDPQEVHFVSNDFIDGPNTTGLAMIEIDETVLPTSRIWIKDCYGTGRPTSDLPEWAAIRGNVSINGADGPLFASHVTRLMPSGLGLLEYVLSNAGARPLDRDAEDANVVADVRARGGSVINCVSYNASEPRCVQNAGGFPLLAANARELVIPPNYWEILPSGYTRLDEWLFDFSWDLQSFMCFGVPKNNDGACSGGRCVAQDLCWCPTASGAGEYIESDCPVSKEVGFPEWAIATIAVISSVVGLLVVVVISLILVVIFCRGGCKKDIVHHSDSELVETGRL